MHPDSKDDLRRWCQMAPVGQPVDLAPWTYLWRADRQIQERPEAYFIPRRLERLDRVYRTARSVLPETELKSIYYEMPDLLRPLLPPPQYPLQLGLLWTGGLVDYQVELRWPAGAPVPAPESVEVRAYPTSFGWFGWTVDQLLGPPALSADGHTWTYQSDPTQQMDSAYSVRVPAATEMIAVFYAKTGVVPDIRVTGPNLGHWQRLDLELEWGFGAGAEKQAFDGRLEPYMALVGPIHPLATDRDTVVSGAQWQSPGREDQRRGLVVPLLYTSGSRPGLDSRLTVWSAAGDFTFRLSDLDQGPILIPSAGVLVTRAGSGQTAARFTRQLAARQSKSVRQQTREHREAGSWEEVMQEVRLWTCPEGTTLSPLPEVPLPPMQVELPDPGWIAAWNTAADQLTGAHMWGGLAFEVGRVAHQMDLIGLHAEAEKIYAHFLSAPGAKPDGDYSDGEGALEWATSMRHDMGYSHDGTHASTGRLLFAMAQRYFLTGDGEWFQQHRARLQAAADWIIRQRTRYLEEAPNRQQLFVAGLMPPAMLGDYALPACDWHWYYVDNALALQGLQRFAEALVVFALDAGQHYLGEAEAFRRDLRRAVDREAALAPVRLGRDGCYHHFIPRMAYARGLSGPELGAPQFPDCDMWVGALPLAEPFAALDAGDFRMMDTLEVMEEMGTSASAVQAREAARKEKGLPTADAWFWHSYSMLPKASHTANIYLLQDDVPNFLRFWTNSYASMVGADGKLWEHWHLGGYAECGAPDNGTAGWFMENFRNLLVMEEGSALWVARATPRAWLESGRQISVRNAPTYFGTLAFRLISEVDQGRITAILELPSRNPPEKVVLRLRHPRATAIRTATVNGRPWSNLDPGKELITLTELPPGEVVVVARY